MLQNAHLAGSYRNIIKSTVPVDVIRKPVLPWTGRKNLVSGFRPGKFILESGLIPKVEGLIAIGV
jgi:hypothetical protein